MTVEEFSDKYENEDTLEIFDETCEFFSQELPQEFFDDWDPIDIILDIMESQEKAKNFDNVIKFIDIVQKYQPELYKESFVYLNEFLVEYYCFYQDVSKVDEALSLYIGKPLHDYDQYLQVYNTIQFYQHTELLKRAIAETYDIVRRSDFIYDGPFDLAVTKHFMILQDLFEDKKGSIDKVELLAKLEEYDFEVSDIILSLIIESMTQSKLSTNELKAMFIKDKGAASMVLLRGYFLRYMYERDFEFYLSGYIWDKMLKLWEKNTKAETYDSYFSVTTASFEKYLVGLMDIFVSNKPEIITILWGSVYIYDFLHKLEIISTEVYQDFLKTSQELKGNVIGLYTPDLWRSNYVHHWMKPDSVSEDEFREEHNIFTKSISFKFDDFSVIRDKMSEELSKIGALADYIIKGGESRTENADSSLYDNIFNNNVGRFDDDGLYQLDEAKHLEPVRIEPKVGRNDPCPCGSGKKYKKCCGKG